MPTTTASLTPGDTLLQTDVTHANGNYLGLNPDDFLVQVVSPPAR